MLALKSNSRIFLEKIKIKFFRIADLLHRKIFGCDMSDEMRRFLGHLSWSFFGGIIASGLMLFVNVFAGRLMGPSEYGKYNLIIVVGQIISIPLIFGLDVVGVRSIAKSKDLVSISKNISSSFYFILSNIVIALFVIFFSHNFLSSFLNISSSVLILAVLFASVSGLKSITDCFVRGLCFFKYQFFGRIGEVLLVVILFFYLFIIQNNQNHFYYLLILVFGSIFLILFNLGKVYPFLSRFDFKILRKQFSYGKIIILGSILGTIFNSLDKLIIAKYLNLAELGIYSAYFMISTNLIAQLTQIFLNVFFPTISKLKNVDNSYSKKIEKLMTVGFVPAFIIIAIIIWVAMKLFGSRYELNYIYVFLFSFLAIFQIYLTINTIIITALSKELFKKYVFRLNLINLVHMFLYGVVVYFNVVSIYVLVISYILNTIFVISIQKKLISQKKTLALQ